MKSIASSFGVKKGFTLLELMVSMTVFLILITAVTTIFINLYKIKGGLEARQRVTQDSYFLLEKLQTMMKDYTIDYEEYWNRQQVGCSDIGNANWNTGGNCSLMTYYGNNNITETASDTNQHKLFYCSSEGNEVTTNYVVGDGNTDPKIDINNYISTCLNDIASSAVSNINNYGFLQSYGQYSILFTDVKSDVDYVEGSAGDDDDVNIGNNTDAIITDADGNVQEIYLISHDKQRRMFIRRHFQEDSDVNGDGKITPSERLYTLQVLQLRGFDAGANHNFDAENYKGVYDGVIDTWACDYAAGFECGGDSIQGVFGDYKLPADSDDGWKDLLGSDITVTDRKINMQPLKNPLLAWDDANAQQNPHVRISLTTQLYAKNWTRKLTLNQMNSYILPLQTMFSFTD